MPPLPSEQNDVTSAAKSPASPDPANRSPELDDTADRVDPATPVDAQANSPKPRVHVPLDFLSPPQAADELGRLDGYRILTKLGEGGMGIVFEAEDIRLKRRVALKVMRPEIAVNEQSRARFIREAQIAAAVEHDHICPIHQVGEENGVPFIAMPFLKGEPLDACLKRHRPLPLDQAVRIALEVAEGLAAAHRSGLIHRDIKPANIWLERKDEADWETDGDNRFKDSEPAFQRVKILDFGLARLSAGDPHLTQSGAMMGTPAYMAPEQARAMPVDHRADLFSLGVLLYEMTTGVRPFSGSDTYSILTSLAVDDPAPPNFVNSTIPAELSDLIMQLLAKAPEKRPANSRAVFEALRTVSLRLPQSANATASVHQAHAIDDSNQAGRTITNAAAFPTLAATASKTPKSSGSRRWIALALGLLLVGGGGLAVYKLTLETKNGTLVVEVDGDADVRFRNGELHIYDADGKRQYTLKPGERSKNMPPGPYKVEVSGADGVKLETPEFTMTKNGATVRVRLDQAPVAKKDEPAVVAKKDEPATVAAANQADRRAAEYVLSIGGSVQINDQNRYLKALADLPKEPFRLSAVDLNGNQRLTNPGLANFEGCRNLTSLLLNGTHVTDSGLAHFKACLKLESLWLGDTQIGDAGLAHFKDCKNLIALDLNNSKVTDAGAAYFKDCPKLDALWLANTQVGDTGLAAFKDCKNLGQLQLRGTRITDAGLAHFRECKKLRTLYLDKTVVSNTGLAHFNDCKILTTLDLSDSKVTDAGLAYFKDCEKLLSLNLKQTKVGDAGLAHFKGKGLMWLNLEDSQVSDAGLADLKDCKKLEQIVLRRAKVSPAGIDKLRKELPYCRIEWDGGVIAPKN